MKVSGRKKNDMSKLLLTIFWLVLAPLALAQGCGTPKNFEALVELVVNEGEPSDYGLSLTADEKPHKYYASLVRGEDLPELYMIQEKRARRGRKEHIDQWILKFTAEDTSVVHKALWEKDHRLLREKRLSSKGADEVGCGIFRAFLGTSPSPR